MTKDDGGKILMVIVVISYLPFCLLCLPFCWIYRRFVWVICCLVVTLLLKGISSLAEQLFWGLSAVTVVIVMIKIREYLFPNRYFHECKVYPNLATYEHNSDGTLVKPKGDLYHV